MICILAVVYSLRKIHLLDRAAELRITKVLYGGSGYVTGCSPEEIDYLQAFDGKG